MVKAKKDHQKKNYGGSGASDIMTRARTRTNHAKKGVLSLSTAVDASAAPATLPEIFSSNNFSQGHLHSIMEYLKVNEISALLRCSKDLYDIRMSSGNTAYVMGVPSSIVAGAVSSAIIANRMMALVASKFPSIAMCRRITLPPNFNFKEMSLIFSILAGHPCCAKLEDLLVCGVVANPSGVVLEIRDRVVSRDSLNGTSLMTTETTCDMTFPIDGGSSLQLQAIGVCVCCSKMSICGGWCEECEAYVCMKSHRFCFVCMEGLETCIDALTCSICDLGICVNCTAFCEGCARDYCDSCGDFVSCAYCIASQCGDCNDMIECQTCNLSFCQEHCEGLQFCTDCDTCVCEQCDGRICMTNFCVECEAIYCNECRETSICDLCSKMVCSKCPSGLNFHYCEKCNTESCSECRDFNSCRACHECICEICNVEPLYYCGRCEDVTLTCSDCAHVDEDGKEPLEDAICAVCKRTISCCIDASLCSMCLECVCADCDVHRPIVECDNCGVQRCSYCKHRAPNDCSACSSPSCEGCMGWSREDGSCKACKKLILAGARIYLDAPKNNLALNQLKAMGAIVAGTFAKGLDLVVAAAQCISAAALVIPSVSHSWVAECYAQNRVVPGAGFYLGKVRRRLHGGVQWSAEIVGQLQWPLSNDPAHPRRHP